MLNVAIIPARGGSKRIPRKNIRLFHGKPIIAYSIEAAINSNQFDKVVISTDDPEIASVAKSYGAEVPFIRPAQLADDFTGTNAVVVHGIRELRKQNISLAYICCIYATAPFLQENYLVQGYDELTRQPNKKFAFSVGKFSYPVQRSFTLETEQRIVSPIDPTSLPKRSQDLPEVYHDAGQFYWASAESFLQQNIDIFSSLSIPIVLPSYLVQDIDNEEDWRRAEMMYQVLMAETE